MAFAEYGKHDALALGALVKQKKISASELVDEAIARAERINPKINAIIFKAFDAARTRRKKLCSVDKANVLETSRLWREVIQKVAAEYPDVQVEHQFVDATAMLLIKDPRRFDVVVTANLFGDILTDEASQIAGSMGMLASASIVAPEATRAVGSIAGIGPL